MKTLLTLFVLFFSYSAVASDDLSGKSIVCGATLEYLCDKLGNNSKCLDTDNPNQEMIMAIEFKNKDQASYYDYKGMVFAMHPSNIEMKLFYKTDLESIIINFEKLDKDSNYILKIDRKSLNYIINDTEEYEIPIGDSCIIYENYEDINNNIIKMKNKILTDVHLDIVKDFKLDSDNSDKSDDILNSLPKLDGTKKIPKESFFDTNKLKVATESEGLRYEDELTYADIVKIQSIISFVSESKSTADLMCTKKAYVQSTKEDRNKIYAYFNVFSYIFKNNINETEDEKWFNSFGLNIDDVNRLHKKFNNCF